MRLDADRRRVVAGYLGRGWAAIMGLAFIPVYTHLMGVEAMGVVGVYVTLQGLCMLLDAGLSTTLNRELARMSQEKDAAQSMRDLVRTFEAPFWILSLLGGILVYLLAPFIAGSWVNVQALSAPEVQSAIRLMGLVLFFQLPMSLYGGGLLGLHRQVEYSLLTAAWYTLRFAGVVIALEIFPPTLHTFFLWQVAVAVLAGATSALLLWRYLPSGRRRARFDRTLFASRWRFAAGLGGISVTLLILNNVDNVMLSRLVSLRSFGYYILAWTLANAVRMLADPIFAAYFPRLSQAWAANDAPQVAKLYHSVARLMSLAVLPLGLTIAFFAPEAVLVWTRSPDLAAHTGPVLRLLTIGNICLAINVVPYALQLAGGWTALPLWSNVVASVVLVPAMAVLAPAYGNLGGGIAWLLLNSIYLAVTVTVMHRRLLPGEGLRWAITDVGRPLLACLAVLGICRLVLPSTNLVLPSLACLVISYALAQGVAIAAAARVEPEQARAVPQLTHQGANL